MSTNAFWQDMQDELQADPEYAQMHLLEWVRVTTVDKIVNQLESERAALGISKVELARAVRRDPAAIRRLLTDTAGNPTVQSVSSVAAAVGLKLELVPMSAEERDAVAEPLQEMASC